MSTLNPGIAEPLGSTQAWQQQAIHCSRGLPCYPQARQNPLQLSRQHAHVLPSPEVLSTEKLLVSRRPLPQLPGFVLPQALDAHREQLVHSGIVGVRQRGQPRS